MSESFARLGDKYPGLAGRRRNLDIERVQVERVQKPCESRDKNNEPVMGTQQVPANNVNVQNIKEMNMSEEQMAAQRDAAKNDPGVRALQGAARGYGRIARATKFGAFGFVGGAVVGGTVGAVVPALRSTQNIITLAAAGGMLGTAVGVGVASVTGEE